MLAYLYHSERASLDQKLLGGGAGARLGVDTADDADAATAAAASRCDSKERAETVTNPAVRPSGLGDSSFSLTRPEKGGPLVLICQFRLFMGKCIYIFNFFSFF